MDDNDSKPRIALARNSARKIIQDIKVEHCPIVLNDVIKHLQKNYDLKVLQWKFGPKTSGMQLTDGEKVTIGYNSDQHSNRQRFTIAHEIGHLVLGHTHSGADFNLKSRDPHEIEANQFAAELLMPLELLKNDYGYGATAPKDLAKNYSVSEEAMWWRLLECRLISY